MKSTDSVNMWTTKHIVDSVGGKIRLLNTNDEPGMGFRHEHICMARPTTSSNFAGASQPALPLAVKETKPCQPSSMSVSPDPDNLLPLEFAVSFSIHFTNTTVFSNLIYQGIMMPLVLYKHTLTWVLLNRHKERSVTSLFKESAHRPTKQV